MSDMARIEAALERGGWQVKRTATGGLSATRGDEMLSVSAQKPGMLRGGFYTPDWRSARLSRGDEYPSEFHWHGVGGFGRRMGLDELLRAVA